MYFLKKFKKSTKYMKFHKNSKIEVHRKSIYFSVFLKNRSTYIQKYLKVHVNFINFFYILQKKILEIRNFYVIFWSPGTDMACLPLHYWPNLNNKIISIVDFNLRSKFWLKTTPMWRLFQQKFWQEHTLYDNLVFSASFDDG